MAREGGLFLAQGQLSKTSSPDIANPNDQGVSNIRTIRTNKGYQTRNDLGALPDVFFYETETDVQPLNSLAKNMDGDFKQRIDRRSGRLLFAGTQPGRALVQTQDVQPPCHYFTKTQSEIHTAVLRPRQI